MRVCALLGAKCSQALLNDEVQRRKPACMLNIFSKKKNGLSVDQRAMNQRF